MDRVGRKTLLYISSAFLSVAQAGLGTYFYFEMSAANDTDMLDDYRQVFYCIQQLCNCIQMKPFFFQVGPASPAVNICDVSPFGVGQRYIHSSL